MLWTVTLPYLKPALIGAAAISFLMSFENFNTTLMLVGSDPPLTKAARLSAYAERVYASFERRPRLVARRNRERLLALLAAERSAAALAKLFDEGLRLTEDEACALALLPSVPGA